MTEQINILLRQMFFIFHHSHNQILCEKNAFATIEQNGERDDIEKARLDIVDNVADGRFLEAPLRKKLDPFGEHI